MSDLKVAAVYFYEYTPRSFGDKPSYRLLKYAENNVDAIAWATDYVRNDFIRRGCSNPEMDAISDYVHDHIRLEEKSLSECLDTLINHTRLLENLGERVSYIEQNFCTEDRLFRRVE